METTTIIDDAVRTFESNIFDVDVKELDASSVRDVSETARIIEREREERQSLCNLRRVESLLKELQNLAGAVRKLPPSSCPEHYIWGPVKLALEIANQDDEALESILSGYARLASGLRFLELIVAIPHLINSLQKVIAYTVSDVLEFHARVYQVLRRGGWQILFKISWTELEPVFDCIIKRLEHSCSLVDRASGGRSNVFEAINISGNATAQLGDRFFDIENATFAPLEEFSAAREFREKVLADLHAKQKRRADHQFLECIQWLDVQSQDRDQANLLSRCKDSREEATCEWILSHPKITSWLDSDSNKTFLWLKGKPGSGKVLTNIGKTTLVTYIIEHAEIHAGGMMLYYFCSHEAQSSQDILSGMLGVLIVQILRCRRYLVPFVFETYVKNAEQPALKLPILLKQLLLCSSTTYLVIDGLNEYHFDIQSRIINKLDSLVARRRNEIPAGPEVKILISSQEAKGVPHKLSKQPHISLTEEHVSVSRDIKTYTMNAINGLEDRFGQKDVEEIASAIMVKANGMFLWVKLVLMTLLEQESLFEIQATLNRLPTGLAGIYKILLERLENIVDARQKPRIRMIFYWILFAVRPMKVWEICDALVIGGSNLALVKDQTMLHPRILDICKPLIEVHKDETVSFVHFSVRDYLLHLDSGPFVLRKDGLSHLTSTCLKYLFTCEDFFSAQQSVSTYRQIVLQLHSLFPYVAETWKNHFSALATELSIPASERERLLSNLLVDGIDSEDRCDNLLGCQRDQQLAGLAKPSQIRTDRELVKGSILQDLRDAPVGSQKSDCFTFSIEDQHDRVNRAFRCFQIQLEQLLGNQCPYSLSQLSVSRVDLDLLRDRHTKLGFLCRHDRCQYSILGFSNIEERDRHERSHRIQFCCPEFGCDFQDVGFESRAALRNHIQRYHKNQENNAVPKLLLGRRDSSMGHSSRSSASMNQDQRQDIWKSNTKDGTQRTKEWRLRRADLEDMIRPSRSSRQLDIENAFIRESNYAPLPADLRQQLERVFPGQNTAGLATWSQLRDFAISSNDPRIPPAKIRTFQLEYARRWQRHRAVQQAIAANKGQQIQEQFEIGGDDAAQQNYQCQDPQLAKQDLIQAGRQIPLDDFDVQDQDFDPISPPPTDDLAGLAFLQGNLFDMDPLNLGSTYDSITSNPRYPNSRLSGLDSSFVFSNDQPENESRRMPQDDSAMPRQSQPYGRLTGSVSGVQTQLDYCCKCRETSLALHQTHCNNRDCLHEYCSNCTTVQPRFDGILKPMSIATSGLNSNTTEQHGSPGSIGNQAQQQTVHTSVSLDVATKHQPQDLSPGEMPRRSQSQAQRHQRLVAQASTVPSLEGPVADSRTLKDIKRGFPSPDGAPSRTRLTPNDRGSMFSSASPDPQIPFASTQDAGAASITRNSDSATSAAASGSKHELAATSGFQPPSKGMINARQDEADAAAEKPLASLSLLHSIQHDSVVKCVDLSPDGKLLATGCDNVIRIFDSDTGYEVFKFRSEHALRCMCYSPDGTDLAIGAQNGSISGWHIKTRQLKFQFDTYTTITSLVYPRDRDHIVSVSEQRLVVLWRNKDGSFVRRFDRDFATFTASYALTGVAISSDNRYVAAVSVDVDDIFVWDYRTGQSIARTPTSSRHNSGIKQVVFSPSGTELASCGMDGTIKIWSIGTHIGEPSSEVQYTCVKTLGGIELSVNSICFADCHRRIIYGSVDGSIGLWNTEVAPNHAPTGMANHNTSVTCVAFNQAGSLLASSSFDGEVKIWRYDVFAAVPEPQSLLGPSPDSAYRQSLVSPVFHQNVPDIQQSSPAWQQRFPNYSMRPGYSAVYFGSDPNFHNSGYAAPDGTVDAEMTQTNYAVAPTSPASNTQLNSRPDSNGNTQPSSLVTTRKRKLNADTLPY